MAVSCVNCLGGGKVERFVMLTEVYDDDDDDAGWLALSDNILSVLVLLRALSLSLSLALALWTCSFK